MKIRKAIKLATLGRKRITRLYWGKDESLKVCIGTSLAIEWTDGVIVETWQASTDDILADDWEVVSE